MLCPPELLTSRSLSGSISPAAFSELFHPGSVLRLGWAASVAQKRTEHHSRRVVVPVVFERAAGEHRPLHDVLAFLDLLLDRTATIVKRPQVLRLPGQIGPDKSDTGKQLARVPFVLHHDLA